MSPPDIAALPERPVRLYASSEDNCVHKLHIFSYDQVGLLLKLCELLASQGIDIVSADIAVEDGIVNNVFELSTCRPSDLDEEKVWCKELEDFVRNPERLAAIDGSLSSFSKRLSVNPDLLSVQAFDEVPVHDGPPEELRYHLELEGINQAGLLVYTSLVLYRSGFNVLRASISTVDGHISDSFDLSTTSAESERLLRTYLDVPSVTRGNGGVHLPFHTTRSDAELQGLTSMWSRAHGNSSCSLAPSPRSSQMPSRAGSFDEFDGEGRPHGGRHSSWETEEPSTGGGGRSLAMVASPGSSFVSHAGAATQGGDARQLAPPAGCAGCPPPANETQPFRKRIRSVSPPARRPKVRSGSGGAAAGGGVGGGSTAAGSPPPAGGQPRIVRVASSPPRQMSVHFANGDLYKGSCATFQGGEKRHGHGTYEYSAGSHETYKQYRGQWREDQKHGHGVLFYRNGGVYVGQWEKNTKHGLGVLLDVAGDSEPTAMPSYRYEGQWKDDEPHGLGAEETESTSYFGNFHAGKPRGRGVRMTASRMGIAGTEAIDNAGRVTPLLDALEAQLSTLNPSRAVLAAPATVVDPPATNYQESFPHANTVHVQCPRIGSVASAGAANLEARADHDSSGSSGTNNRSPASTRTGYMGRHEVPASPGENEVTPLLGAGSHALGMMNARGHSRTLAGGDDATPVDGLQCLSMLAERGPAGALAPTSNATTASAPTAVGANGAGGTADAFSPGGHLRQRPPGRTVTPPPPSSSDRLGNLLRIRSRSTSASPRESASGGVPSAATNGGVIFSLCEENNLLSPGESKLNCAIPEDDATSQVKMRPLKSPENALAERSGGSSSSGSGTRRLHKRSSEPWDPITIKETFLDPGPLLLDGDANAHAGAGDAAAAAAGDVAGAAAIGGISAEAAQGAAAAGITGQVPDYHRAFTIGGWKKDRQPHHVAVRTPMLWSEDECAAFLLCLGIDLEICRRVQRRKIKGVVHLLEMSNSELRREFNLSRPVERLVVRQALKRLLEADRWEHSVRGHKMGDLLSDSVLSKFIVPLSDLTLVTKISQGGYGTVYRAMLEPSANTASGLRAAPRRPQLVAVKEMKGERRVRLYELLKEACVMASLKHPNICTFLGVVSDMNARSTKHYIISELMDCSLFDLIHQPFKLRWHGDLTPSLVVGLSKGIGAGIAYIHQNHLVHADLKSSNILIDYSTSWHLIPRICDFGHAAMRTFPTPHHRCGTPHWAAPEVLRSEALGPKADVYSFGVIIWEMLTQRVPHKGLSFGQVLASVGWAGWTPDLSQLPAIPPELLRLLKECLAFSPSERPHAREVSRRLRRIPKQAMLKALQMLVGFLGC